jgi:uncharacterized protein involved in outer membrane biogenesis
MANETNTTSRKPRRWLRWIGYFFGFMIVGLLMIYFVGTSEWALKKFILPQVSKSMNAEVTIESSSISPFSSVQLRGLKVQTTGKEPLVSAQEIRARYSLMDIIKGNINVQQVEVKTPVVTLITFADGSSNLDPLTKQSKDEREKKPKEPKEKKSGKVPQLNLQRVSVTDLSFRKIDERKDGTRQTLAVTMPAFTVNNIGNDKSGKIVVSAIAKLDQGLTSASNGVFVAKLQGEFDLALDAVLKPKTVKGQTKVDVTEAQGTFAQAAGLGITLNTDLTPTQLNDVSVRFAQNGKSLGAIVANGPFNAETSEGKLLVTISQIDRQVLNLAGAAMGVDFNRTTIGSTNTIELAQRGKWITVNGSLLVGSFSATQNGQTTPSLDVRSAYSVSYDQANNTARVQTFALNGTQNGAEFLRGTLSKPMLLELGKASGAVDESAFDLVLTNFNLPDWRAFLGTNVNLASGRVGVNLKLISKQAGKELQLAGKMNIDEVTGAFQSNRFDRFTTSADLDVAVRGDAVEIRKLSGTLQQSGQAGGAFEVAGNYHLSNKTGLITATLTDLNQNVLKSFLAGALGDKQLESIVMNSKTTAKLDGPTDMAVKTELHVANLVVNDPSGQVPKTPLAVDLNADVAMVKQVIDLRGVQLALTKTERAPNSLNVAGRIDMSKSNAWKGNVRITSEGIDVTPYYDLFAKKQTNGAPSRSQPSTSQTPKETKPETEPPPMTLPFTEFVNEVNIAKFFLREIAISNLVSKTTIENGRVNANPFTLTLNGAPVSMTALMNLAVTGYEYDVNAKLDRVPVEPLANSFMPEQRGIYKGNILSSVAIKGSGVTGPSLQKNLNGAVSFILTNAEVKVADARFENRYAGWLVKWLPTVAKYLQVPELMNTPITLVDSQVQITNGVARLSRTFLESPAFQANVPGTVTLNEIMTNSTLNKLPVQLTLRRSIAEMARLEPKGRQTPYVELPSFVSIEGTVGKPKYDVNEKAVLQLVAKAASGFLKGDAGNLLRGLGTPGTTTTTNAAGSTNASPSTTESVGNLLKGFLNKPEKTNAPAQKRNR